MPQINFLPKDPNLRDGLHQDMQNHILDIVQENTAPALKSISALLQQDWIPLRSDKGDIFYYHARIAGIFPDMKRGQLQTINLQHASLPALPPLQFKENGQAYSCGYLTEAEFREYFSKNLQNLSQRFQWDLKFQSLFIVISSNRRHCILPNGINPKLYQLDNMRINKSAVAVIPVVRLQEGRVSDVGQFIRLASSLGLTPILDSTEQPALQLLISFYELEKSGKSGDVQALAQLLKQYANIPAKQLPTPEGSWDMWSDRLLTCDKQRANLPEYDEARLSNDLGHWDLYEELVWNIPAIAAHYHDKLFDVKDRLIFARDPKADIRVRPSYVAVDFGTKSTVVASCGSNAVISPHIIGEEMLNAPNVSIDPNKQFENPTVIKFVSLDSFLEDYNKKGRPDTKWNDISTSHSALEDLQTSKAEDIPQYVTKLKQWANNPKRAITVIDGQKQVYSLRPYMEQNRIDPIELYAYYIGLYINKMSEGHIYMDYLLAFPTSYAPDVCEKIRKSFKCGLARSIPGSLQADKKLMENFFHVQMSLSEPAAYAVCAIETQARQEDGPFLYGVYDFGGGTTDFSIGAYCPRNARQQDNQMNAPGNLTSDENLTSAEKIHNMIHGQKAAVSPAASSQTMGCDCLIELANGGVSDLGGENLLEEAAWQAFTKNLEKLPENIHFTAPTADYPLEYRNYVSTDIWAQKNTLNMIDKLRPIWEGTDATMGTVSPALYSYNAKTKQADQNLTCPLEIDVEEITEFFRNKIYNGVNSFMQLLNKTILEVKNGQKAGKTLQEHGIDCKKIKKAYIFLGGNASRSQIVSDLFKQETEKLSQIVSDLFKQETEKTLQELKIELCPPMDSDSQYKNNDRWIYPPTAKTGIAYGLLLAKQKESRMQIISLPRSVFRFVIGQADLDNNTLIPFSDEELLEGCCFEVVNPHVSDYVLYFTDNVNARETGLPIIQTQGINIHLTDDTAKKYAGSPLYVRVPQNSESHIEVYIQPGDASPHSVGTYDLNNPMGLPR